MMKLLRVVSIAALGLAPVTAALAADQEPTAAASNTAPVAAPDSASNANPNAGYAVPAAQNPMGTAPEAKPLADNWTKVKGTVQSADAAANQVKIQDEKGNLSQVTVDSDVTIRKDGKTVAIGDLQTGDRIVITRRKTTPSSNPS